MLMRPHVRGTLTLVSKQTKRFVAICSMSLTFYGLERDTSADIHEISIDNNILDCIVFVVIDVRQKLALYRLIFAGVCYSSTLCLSFAGPFNRQPVSVICCRCVINVNFGSIPCCRCASVVYFASASF